MKLSRKQLQTKLAMERRKQRRRLERRSLDSDNGETVVTVTNAMLDEMTLQNCISRIVSMLPSCKRKRPAPTPLKSSRTSLWRRFPLPSRPKACPWFKDRSDNLSDELRNFAAYVKVSLTLLVSPCLNASSSMRVNVALESKS